VGPYDEPGCPLEPPALLVLTTCATAQEAERLSTVLLEQRLAACINRFNGVVSSYRWQGAIEHAEESLLLIKTTPERYAAVSAAIRSLSSYELPEILAVPVERGSADYLSWLAAAVGAQQ
jgi:periplasmic divalent cation tolerance protein